MSTTADEVNPYELIGATLESTESDIRTAYRQKSLKVHPDRNLNNPDAARKFHELNQAYELLLDPLRRMALDAKLRAKEERKKRFAAYDTKRKGLVEELEERERALKKARVENEAEKTTRWQENERIMEEGRRLREERERQLREREKEREQAERTAKEDEEPPELGAQDTTVRLKYPLLRHPTLTTPSALATLLAPFGAVDETLVLVSLKPAPPKRPKRAIVLAPFKQIGGAFAAVCASGRKDRGLENVEIDWAAGKEPELIGWLKKAGKLDGGKGRSRSSNAETPRIAFPIPRPTSATLGADGAGPSSAPLSSFPLAFRDLDSLPSTTSKKLNSAPGLDFESVTLMRLRQAERERLEREILEQEAAD